MPSGLPVEVREKLEPIRLVVLDVDGVLTDGSLFYSGDGEEYKRFSVRDGLAIRLLLRAGIQVAVISGRPSVAVLARCSAALPLLARAGFAACPTDAAPEVIAACDLVCGAEGGRGAVRELAEVVLKAQGRWTELVSGWVTPGMQRG